jgi:ribosomal protein S18 acetylase RimI-like enzyme
MKMINIRKLLPSEALLWKKYRIEALQNHPENYLASSDDELKLSDADWEKRITDNEIFGLFEESCLMSMLAFTILPQEKSQHIGEIWAVYTLPDARGKGYLTQLMEHVLDYEKDRVDHFRLACNTLNIGAFRIYQKLGFTVYGTERKAVKINDTFYDEYLMCRDKERQPQPVSNPVPQNPTVERFFKLKTDLGNHSQHIQKLFKDCIYHDVSLGSLWQSMVYCFRMLCYYVFNTGRYHDLELLISTLSPQENAQLKQSLNMNDISSYMLSC